MVGERDHGCDKRKEGLELVQKMEEGIGEGVFDKGGGIWRTDFLIGPVGIGQGVMVLN